MTKEQLTQSELDALCKSKWGNLPREQIPVNWRDFPPPGKQRINRPETKRQMLALIRAKLDRTPLPQYEPPAKTQAKLIRITATEEEMELAQQVLINEIRRTRQ